MTDSIIGHGTILEHFRRRARKGNLAHAYLFTGPEGIGKRQVALRLAQSLLCVYPEEGVKPQEGLAYCGTCTSCEAVRAGTHPDVSMPVVSEGGVIGMEDIRTLRRSLALRSGLGAYKVVIMDSTERLTTEAANALLKLLEEPKGKAIYFLLTAHPAQLLPTIRSRAEMVRFRPVSRAEVREWLKEKGYAEKEANEAAHRAFGRPGEALTLLTNPVKSAAYESRAAALAKLLRAPLNDRLLFAEELKDERDTSLAHIRSWTLLIRDVLLSRLSLGELAVFADEKKKLESLFARYSPRQLARAMRIGEKAQWYLEHSTVQPRAVIEYFLLHV